MHRPKTPLPQIVKTEERTCPPLKPKPPRVFSQMFSPVGLPDFNACLLPVPAQKDQLKP